MRKLLLPFFLLFFCEFCWAQSERSDELFAQGTELYKQQKFWEAIAVFERCDSLDAAEMDSTSNRLNYCKNWLAACYYNLGDTVKAAQLHYAYMLPPVDRRLTTASDSAAAQGSYHYSRKEYRKALECFDRCRKLETRIVGENHHYIANDYINISNCEVLLGDTVVAAMHLRKAADIRVQAFGMRSQWTYSSCCDAAYFSSWVKEFQHAKTYMLIAMEAWRNINGTDNDTYLRHIQELNKYFLELKDWQAASDIKREELSIRERMTGKEDFKYIQALNSLALYLYRQENYIEAAVKTEEAIVLQRKVEGEFHQEVLMNLNNLRGIYEKLNDIPAYLRIMEQMLDIMEHARLEGDLAKYGLQGQESLMYKIYLYNSYRTMPDNEKAMRFAQAYKEELVAAPAEQQTTQQALNLRSIAVFEFYMGLNSMSENDMKEALDILERTEGKESTEYLGTLQELCQICKRVNNWTSCIRYSEELYEACERVYGHEHAKTAEAMMLLGDAYFYAGDDRFRKSMELHREGLELTRRTAGERSTQYAYALMDYIDDFNVEEWTAQKKIDYLEEALDILKENEGPESSSLFRPMHDIAAHQVLIGEYGKAAATFEQLLNMKKKNPSTTDKDIILLGKNLCTTLYYGRMCDRIAAVAPETQSLIEKQVYRSFSTMTEYERDIYWREHSGWFDDEMPRYAKETGNDSLTVLAYDAQLFSKGLLLNTEIGLQQTIMESNDPALLQQWQELQELRVQMNRQQKQMTNVQREEMARLKQEIHVADSLGWGMLFMKMDSVDKARATEQGAPYREKSDSLHQQLRQLQDQILGDNLAQVASLQQRIDNAERQLVVATSRLNNKDWFQAIRTADVASHIPPAAAAIEFVCFQDTFLVETKYGEIVQNPQYAYYAMVLKQGQQVPQLVRLCSKDAIKNISKDSLYTTSRLSDIIWLPLRHILEDVKDVYFSPMDELNVIAIESLPETESWNLYRLSSTRELVTHHKTALQNDAVLYGGIRYELSDLEREQLVAMAREEDTFYDTYDRPLTRDMRGVMETLPELPGSLTEVEVIRNQLNKEGLTVEIRTDATASEESFKALSGKPVSVLHISTHGFYEREQRRGTEDLDRHVSHEEMLLRERREELALAQSGLLLAGAANYLFEQWDDDTPQGDDGILTAKEISRLNLNGVNLVVLSACETGLGGLQVGFKKAGAQSILMSLWKVDDEATCLLMTEFYKNWMGGATKHDALEMAKQTVRSHTEKGWDDPKYWAAFILLDALD